MKEVTSLKTASKKKTEMSVWFLYALALFLYSPMTAISSMYGMVGDTAIQIKVGLDDLRLHKLITEEIYSWHEGLVWTAHEQGWYFLLGAMYKILGLAGVILVGALFIYGTVYLIVRFNAGKVHPLIFGAILTVIPIVGAFPDYNVRPSVVSTFFIVLLITSFLNEWSGKKLFILFSVSSFIMAWLHGGILPVFFAVYIVLIAIELLYRQFRKSLVMAAAIPAGFVLSLLNPIGIRIWTFGFIQSAATDIWALVEEWQPKTFSIAEIFTVLLVFVGMMTNSRLRDFEKKAVTKAALLSMFFIMSCLYCRFMLYFTVAYLLFAPEEIESLLTWLNDNTFKFDTKKITLSPAFYGILTAVCLVIALVSGGFDILKYFSANDMTDIERMAAYDHNVIDIVKEKGYEKPYNSFNTGSWLLFYDIPVHIDNRIDPFMEEYSGVDHIRGKMMMYSLDQMDSFREEYDNDVFIIELSPGYSSMIEDVKLASDRYEIIYDNTVYSNLTDSIGTRWVIVECK